MRSSNKEHSEIIKRVRVLNRTCKPFPIQVPVNEIYKKKFFSITGKPGMLDLKGKAKWNSWSEKKGMSQDEAKEKYIAFVDMLMEKYKE